MEEADPDGELSSICDEEEEAGDGVAMWVDDLRCRKAGGDLDGVGPELEGDSGAVEDGSDMADEVSIKKGISN